MAPWAPGAYPLRRERRLKRRAIAAGHGEPRPLGGVHLPGGSLSTDLFLKGCLLIDKKDFASSLFLLVLGLFLAFQSFRLSVWSQFGPDEGFFPLAIAVVIIVLSLIILLKALHPARAEGETGTAGTWRGKKETIFKVSFYTILMVAYGLLMERLGFLMASTLLLFPLAKIVERQSWTKALMLVGISIATSYILFACLLGVPLPKGPVRGW